MKGNVFTSVSRILSRGGGMDGEEVCMAGGHVWWGAYMAGGMRGGGTCVAVCAWQGGVAEETTTAADGTHPPGMHSCYHLRMQVGNVFSHVCLCVCLSVFLSVQAITFEPLNIETSFLVCRYILTISRSSLSIKVIGSRSRSYDKKW